MTAPRPTYNLHRFYSTEFDGEAERLSMADAGGREFFVILECGKGGRELAARRDRAVEILLGAMRDGLEPGLRGVIVTPHTLATAKGKQPETYGTPREEQAA